VGPLALPKEQRVCPNFHWLVLLLIGSLGVSIPQVLDWTLTIVKKR
jgi:hypothetical protein